MKIHPAASAGQASPSAGRARAESDFAALLGHPRAPARGRGAQRPADRAAEAGHRSASRPIARLTAGEHIQASGSAAAGQGRPNVEPAPPDDAARAAADLIMQPLGAQRDQARAQGAYGFGVFGVFPPGYGAAAGAAVATSGAPAGRPDAVERAADERGSEILSGAFAEATGVLSATDGEGSGAPAPPEALAAPPVATEVGPESLALMVVRGPDAELGPTGPGEAGAAARRSTALPLRRSGPPASLLLNPDGDGLAVVAAARLDGAQQAEARIRLRAAAADLGAVLEDVRINGSSGGPPLPAGGRHGARTR